LESRIVTILDSTEGGENVQPMTTR